MITLLASALRHAGAWLWARGRVDAALRLLDWAYRLETWLDGGGPPAG